MRSNSRFYLQIIRIAYDIYTQFYPAISLITALMLSAKVSASAIVWASL